MTRLLITIVAVLGVMAAPAAQQPAQPSQPTQREGAAPAQPSQPAQRGGAQPQPPSFRGGIDLVSLNVTVTDSTGRYVTDLPSAIISVTRGSRTKRIEHDHGCGSAPGALAVLEKRIDEVLGSEGWTGGRRVGR